MKKHATLLMLSGALLALAACSGGSGNTSVASSQTPGASSQQQSTGLPPEQSSAPGRTSQTSAEESSTAPASTSQAPAESSTAPAQSSVAPATSSEPEESSVEPATSVEPVEGWANGVFNYKYEDGEERTKILGLLEGYAVDNKLTGLTLYGDGGYVMYNPIVTKGSNAYIPGYGFGILGEGELTGDLAGESNPDWKRYYHTFQSEDPLNINYMNDKGSVVGDLIGYVSSAYFDIHMNETKDGYDWVGDLSPRSRPIAVNPDAKGFTKKYRVEVKVGEDLKYSTTSTKYAAFNNREVTLEDYITPYKIYYTQAFGMARGGENLTGASSIAGSQAYYNASKEAFDATAWEGVGVKAVEEDGKSFVEFTFNNACTRFYAMYYLASSMFAPVPAEFIEAIGGGDFVQGVKNWGTFTDTESIADHWLCTGPYMFERWDKNQQIVFTKNPNYDDQGRYKIQGVHVNILTAAQDDSEAGFKEFMADKLHATSIPATQLEAYREDPRTTMTSDSSTYKLNLNTCDQATWESLFGTNGSIVQTPKTSYWDLKPAMANKDFVSGLSFALDRQGLANYLGRTPSGNYFGSAYMSDPEGGVSYNNTQAHKDAVAPLMEGTDGFGFSLEKAQESFLKASETLIAEGAYEEGDEIEIEICWQTNAQVTREGAVIAGYLEKAFNTDDNPLTLKVKNWVGANWYDVYYDKMMLGQFDIGFGSVSGNTLDPLNFLEVLKSDNSSTFTLNWGLNTNANDKDHLIEYDGKLWSFDALWTAADHGAYVVNGANEPLFSFSQKVTMSRDADNNLVLEGLCNEVSLLKEGVTEPTSYADFDAISMLYGIIIYGQTGDAYHEDPDGVWLGAGLETMPSNDPKFNTKFVCTIPAATVAQYVNDTDRLGFDLYTASAMFGETPEIGYTGSIAIAPGSIPAAK